MQIEHYKRYVMEDAVKIDEFLGSSSWRDKWTDAEGDGVSFPKLLAEEFALSMESLGYLHTPIHKMKLVRSDEKTCLSITSRPSRVIRSRTNFGTMR